MYELLRVLPEFQSAVQSFTSRLCQLLESTDLKLQRNVLLPGTGAVSVTEYRQRRQVLWMEELFLKCMRRPTESSTLRHSRPSTWPNDCDEILNTALASRSLYQLVTYWLSLVMHADPSKLNFLF